MIDVSIIIPTYNRGYILEKCLKALFNQVYPKDRYEIILVDDGSTDGTDRMVASLNPPCRLKYLKNEKRIGQPKSRNKAIREARGEVIISTDSDIIVVPDFISQHISFHKKYKDIMVKGELIQISNLNQVGKKKKGILDISFSSFDTANVSVKKEHLIKVGGFDEDFLPYGFEDLELGYRLRKLGLKPKKNPLALGYHYKPLEKTFNPDTLYEREKMRGMNAALYWKKHPTLRVKLATQGNPLFALSFIGKYLAETERGKKIFSHMKGNKKLFMFLSQIIGYHYYLEGFKKGKTKNEKDFKKNIR
ncbi:glycosyltransferase family 2 protein [Candidatus Aerophobetes bacterium]|uniref:Glycosyltransferase family 2 protein n=1 Tax=Aerophobetes bacterium TaxID=2030807 RepID=A0A662DGS2_UNCAE|nr:MAG: glycosyltransferase family 2 protein [Candidatus Aerophobetes bacterium]